MKAWGRAEAAAVVASGPNPYTPKATDAAIVKRTRVDLNLVIGFVLYRIPMHRVVLLLCVLLAVAWPAPLWPVSSHRHRRASAQTPSPAIFDYLKIA
jgi:hypothetical protein